MTKTNIELRKKAETLAKKNQIDISDLSENDIKKIIYELEVHQIQLEMQNNELKQIQKELDKEKLNFADLYNNAPDGYVTLNESQKIIQTNKTILDMFDFEKSNIIGRQFNDFIHWDDKDIFYSSLLQLSKKGNIQSFQLRLNTAKNSYFHANIEAIVHEKKNIRIAITNISKQVEMQKKAEESDRLKSAFLTNMSHEIRTPMNGILGFSELLKNPDLNVIKQKKYLDIIERSGERLLNFTNDIISISKIDSGQIEVKIANSEINRQIEFIQNFFLTETEKKGITFTIKTSLSTSKSIIETDGEKLYSILINLVKNAIKYTKAGTIEVGYSKIGDFLQFYVKDTGIGIEKERQKAIFERFIQADIEDRDVYEGAGLGLSISKAFVELLGGEIWVESNPSQGSTFFFTIPYIIEQKEIEKSLKSKTTIDLLTHIKKLKLLIVEDDETSALLLEILLDELNPEILTATNGIKAVKMCHSNPDLDLILMDIKIPGLDGYEAARQIRAFNKSVVIIAQSAYGLTGDDTKAISAGCDAYLKKPIVKNELFSLMNKYLAK